MNDLPVIQSSRELRSSRTGVGGAIDRLISLMGSVAWYYYLIIAYGFLIPVVALNLPGIGGVGAADLLMPIGALVLIALPRTGKIQTPHIALAIFCLAALVSLLQIQQTKPAIDCTIRWVRLFGIFIPFYFSLFVPVHDKVIKCAFVSWIVGGLVAIGIGVLLHIFQIEVRAGQQRLWMDGGSMLRAGGLIGNSLSICHRCCRRHDLPLRDGDILIARGIAPFGCCRYPVPDSVSNPEEGASVDNTGGRLRRARSCCSRLRCPMHATTLFQRKLECCGDESKAIYPRL